MHPWEYESYFGDIKGGNLPPEEDYEIIRYARKFVAKFDGCDGWHDIVFCTVTGCDVDTYCSIDRIIVIIFVSNSGEKYTIASTSNLRFLRYK